MTHCLSCGVPVISDEDLDFTFCHPCLEKIHNDCKKIAEKWKELDDQYRAGLLEVLRTYCIERYGNDEGIDVEFFFRGRYIHAQLEWSGDVSDYDYHESLEEIWDLYQTRLRDTASAFMDLVSEHYDEIEKTCLSLGYGFDWDEYLCWYRHEKYSLTSCSYQTDWTLIEVDD